MSGGVGEIRAPYGQGIPVEDETSNFKGQGSLINYNPAQFRSSDWKSLTQSANTSEKTEFSSGFRMLAHPMIKNREALEEYKSRWTLEVSNASRPSCS